MRTILIAVLLFLVILEGCGYGPLQPQIVLDNKTTITLRPPETLQRSVVMVHRARLKTPNGELVCTGQLEITPDRMTVVWFAGVGPRLFSANFEKGVVTEDRMEYVPLPISSVDLLLSIEMAFWPAAELEQGGAGKLEVHEGQAGTCIRTVMSGPVELARIHYSECSPWKGAVEIRRVDAGYTLQIEVLELAVQ